MPKQRKFRKMIIKLYSDQFEVWETDGRKREKPDTLAFAETKEVLVAMAYAIDHFMKLSNVRPLILTIEEGVFTPGGKAIPRDH